MTPEFLVTASVGLIGLSATLSSSETAFFSLPRRQLRALQAEGGWAATAATALLARRNNLLMTLLLCNLLVNLLYFAFASELSLLMRDRGHPVLAPAVLVTAVLVLVLVGEVVPKAVARVRPLWLVKVVAVPVLVVERAALPIVFVLGRVTDLLTRRLVGAPRVAEEGRQEFLRLADALHRKGVLAEQQRRFLHEVLEFTSLKVRDVMVPRVDVAGIDLEGDRTEATARIRERKVSRLLAYRSTVDQVEGMLVAHEVVLRNDRTLVELLHPIPAVPEQGSAARALEVLRERQDSLALVVDEYGGTAGVITTHDLVAEILGELADEHRRPGVNVVEKSPGRFLVAGRTLLREWRELHETEEPDESSQTVGGLVVKLLDRSPRSGDEVTTDRFHYRVLHVRGGRVLLVEAWRLEPTAEEPA